MFVPVNLFQFFSKLECHTLFETRCVTHCEIEKLDSSLNFISAKIKYLVHRSPRHQQTPTDQIHDEILRLQNKLHRLSKARPCQYNCSDKLIDQHIDDDEITDFNTYTAGIEEFI